MSHRLPTRVLTVDPEDPDPAALAEAAGVLRRGGLVAFATETVYGLGAVAGDEHAVAKIFAAKGRPATNPVIVHVADIDQARGCVGDWPEAAEALARRFWPGPLTLVLNRSGRIPDVVSAGQPTVAVRAPAGAVALGLIAHTGEPIAAPSANRSNRISPTRAEHVLADLDGRIDLLLDSGPTAVGLESTVVDLTGKSPRLLRPGPITSPELEAVLPGRALVLPVPGASVERPTSPGRMPVHYAPRTPSFRVDTPDELARLAARAGMAVIAIGDAPAPPGTPRAPVFRLETPARASRHLYETLHHCDVLGLRAIVVVMPPDRPEWQAVRDRLLRATRPLAEYIDA
jgi:L-threonylcarbamoyladenylate synthase